MARGGRVVLDQRAIDALASAASVKLLTEACEVVLRGANTGAPCPRGVGYEASATRRVTSARASSPA